MFKKGVFCILILTLSGCGWLNKETNEELEYKGTAKSEEVNNSYMIVEITIKGDKISEVKMDETNAMSFDGNETGTKKELGAKYNMKAYSDINMEWDEQIKALEDYIVANGIDSVILDDKGAVAVDDLKTSCTINVEEFITLSHVAYNSALNNK